MPRRMPLGVHTNNEDKYLGWEWVVCNLIKAIELAPRRSSQPLTIGLLFLICLMSTLKEIKKNVKRFLRFRYGRGLSELPAGRGQPLWLPCHAQPWKLIHPYDMRNSLQTSLCSGPPIFADRAIGTKQRQAWLDWSRDAMKELHFGKMLASVQMTNMLLRYFGDQPAS